MQRHFIGIILSTSGMPDHTRQKVHFQFIETCIAHCTKNHLSVLPHLSALSIFRGGADTLEDIMQLQPQLLSRDFGYLDKSGLAPKRLMVSICNIV